MFRKPIKIKFNNQLRSSDRKHLMDSFLKCYPHIKEDEIKEIFPKKEGISLVKVETSAGIVEVYLIQKRAVAFKVNDLILPTIYTMWKYPDLLITFTTYPLVLSKLKEGADLMLPGVKLPKSNIFYEKYGSFQKGTPASVNLDNNKATVAIGITGCSSDEIFQNRGKCVIIYHTFGDKLCTMENMPLLHLPELSPPDWIVCENEESSNPNSDIKEETEKIKAEEEDNPQDLKDNDSGKLDETENVEVSDEDEIDKLLKHCFLSAVKFSKHVQLPILTSTFYKANVVPYCPQDKSLDIKKSSFKKLSNFLKEMAELGIITVQETKPGVDSIVEIHTAHPVVLSFTEGTKLSIEEKEESNPVIEEAYTVTASVLPIFAEFGVKKGSSLKGMEIRQYIKEYVNKFNLQEKDDPKKVCLNGVLSILFKGQNSVTWEELFRKLFESMGSCYKIQNKETEILQKGKLEPIVLTVVTRTGNKKVTLIDNLETFGINIETFAKECQQGVAASTSINTVQGKKSKQLLVQGNQINFISTSLINKYKIPKKYISGIENAPKKKK